MPLPQNFHAFLGAAFLGVVSAAGVFLVEHYRQERQRHAMAKDLARLDQELSQVKKELSEILLRQKEKSAKGKKSKGASRANSAMSVMSLMSTATVDGYNSANELESSDMEYYDVSDEENGEVHEAVPDSVLNDLDAKLDEGDMDSMEQVRQELEDLSVKHPTSAEIFWRIAKVHHRIYDRIDVNDTETKLKHLIKGIAASHTALQLDSENGCAHKWMAILLGTQSDYLPLKEKIASTHQFKKHVVAALKHYPKDESLHHMLGRLSYEMASLKWYERKVAAALFGEPPTATYEEALEHFMEAEKLSEKEWKTNKLFVAKCKIALSDITEALSWLDQAEKIEDNNCDPKDCQDMKKLLEQYKGYR